MRKTLCILGFWTIVLTSVLSNAQSADSLYGQKFARLSLVVQRARMVGNEVNNGPDNTIGIGYDKTNSIQFGFYWNFLQTHAFNFRTGIIAKEFAPSLNLHLPNSELGFGSGQYSDNALVFSTGFLFSVPVKAEYHIPLTTRLRLVPSAAVSVNFATGDFKQERLGYSIYDPSANTSRDFFDAVQEQRKITFSADLGVGIAYDFGFLLAQADMFYSKALGNAATGTYQFYNLDNSPVKTGSFKVSGDFFGVGLVLTPKKKFWKK